MPVPHVPHQLRHVGVVLDLRAVDAPVQLHHSGGQEENRQGTYDLQNDQYRQVRLVFRLIVQAARLEEDGHSAQEA